MNRRNAIGNMVLLSIGAALLPSCAQQGDAAFKFKNFSLSSGEEAMMAQLSDMIIPKTNFIGASDLKAHEFTLMMVDDCYDPERQKKFIAGLKEFDKQARAKYGSAFTGCSLAQKKEWLTALEQKTGIPEDTQFFYQTAKRHTVQAFESSKEYMMDVLHFKLVPGSNFKGCVPLKKA